MTTTQDTGWHEDAVVYSIDVKTFNDSDGDGWGDFRGVVERLEYLADLGVDCLWLRPFYPSPLRDNGYDVADYRAVDDRLGTLADFRTLCDRAHERGLRILTDLVFNHTSTDHEWFQRAREDPESKYHDYYLWTSHLDDAYHTVNIFPDREDGVWTYDDIADKHYFHQFYGHQPDLDVANPAVQEEMFDVLRFWLGQGADGFRIDAAHPMQQPKGHHGHRLADPMDLFKQMRRVVREEQADAILLAEADDQPDDLAEYFGNGEAFDLMFDFVGNAHLTYGVGIKDTWPLYRAEELMPDVDGLGQWATFLRNHDEWNLLKLPDEDIEFAREFFGDDAGDSWIFDRGHRLRLADLYDADHDRIEMVHSLLLSMPGTPVLLAGDEIGMGADLSLPEREAVRTPMQWDDSENGGFSSADPSDLYNPVVDEGRFSYEHINVAAQRDDPNSLLTRVQRLVAAHKERPEINEGEYTIVDSGHRDVFVHRLETAETVLLCAHSFADEYRESVCEFEADGTAETVVGAGGCHVEDDNVTFLLEPCDYVWLEAKR
ncbi:alpha-amylase family protein [Haloarcula onubensis]|uniref:Alpha-amylase family protein n=1 Tax=Haloarcula onubensis TaxID=2950539 RepID=A0ABU2FP14_9EURY|nr:alpha-amylase family protein [Halomicroarcula sp. S3CR25-11]MDS0282032.1 alpha-amylase family protein [Halomicroarcula sp. S3CR25-11]